MHLSHGPVWQIVLFSLGPQQPQRLLLILHHLVVDGVSWRILLGDLFTLYHQYLADHELQLPPKTTAFQDWALNLDAYTQSTELKAQLDYWLNLSWPLVKSLPVDTANPANRAIVADTKNITVSLTTDETEQLLKQVPKAYNTQINDVLLTALAEVLGDWSNSNTVLVNLEGHGRSALFEQVDVSRTVGWFTSLYPVVLTVAPNAFPGENLKAVKEQLRGIPQEGIGYGLLGYMTQDVEIKEKLRTLPTPELSFNYLGQVEQGLNVANNWSLAPETIGSFHSPEGRKPHMIDISAQVVAEGLQVIWSYSQAHHHPETINNFSQDYIRRLKVLIGHCLSEEAGGYTPSDFPLVDLTQGDLDEMLEQFDLS